MGLSHNQLKTVSLVVLFLQSTSLVLFTRYSRTSSASSDADAPTHRYISSTAVFVAELLKLIVCICVVGWSRPSWRARWDGLLLDLTGHGKFRDSLQMTVPAALYAVQNNLLFIALSNLEAPTFQVIYQLKILTTALFSVFLLGKRLTPIQWCALVLLMIGVAMVQLQAQAQAQTAAEKAAAAAAAAARHVNPYIGLMAVLTACCTSGFAGVYFEKVLKKKAPKSDAAKPASLWVKNIQLALWGSVFSGVVMMLNDASLLYEHGFFVGYSPVVWIVILNQGFGGLVVAVVVKYSDNIMKGFANSGSIVCSAFLSFYLFDARFSMQFVFGTVCVLSSVYIYGHPKAQHAAQLAKQQRSSPGPSSLGSAPSAMSDPQYQAHHRHQHGSSPSSSMLAGAKSPTSLSSPSSLMMPDGGGGIGAQPGGRTHSYGASNINDMV